MYRCPVLNRTGFAISSLGIIDFSLCSMPGRGLSNSSRALAMMNISPNQAVIRTASSLITLIWRTGAASIGCRFLFIRVLAGIVLLEEKRSTETRVVHEAARKNMPATKPILTKKTVMRAKLTTTAASRMKKQRDFFITDLIQMIVSIDWAVAKSRLADFLQKLQHWR